MPGTLTAGIVGFGRAGRRRLAGMRSVPAIDVRFVVDPDGGARNHPDGAGLAGFAGLGDALAAHPVDILIVSTPPAFHEAAVTAGLAAGVDHLLVEKPLCCSAAAARRVQRRVAEAGAHLKVGSNLRCFPEVRTLLEILDGRRVGEVREATFNVGHDGNSLPAWGRSVAQAGGGTLLDNGVHVIDLALRAGFLRGKVRIEGDVQWSGTAIDDHATWTVEEEGRTLRFSSSWRRTDGVYFSARVAGSRGEVSVLVAGPDSAVSFDGEEGSFTKRHDGPADSWGDDTRLFLEAALNGGRAGATIDAGAVALDVVEWVYRAAKRGERVEGFIEPTLDPGLLGPGGR